VSFNGKMRDEMLDCEIFFIWEEATNLFARWREEYNHIRLPIALVYTVPSTASLVAG